MFSFIVLHYKNIEETLECLTNLKVLIADNDAHIIVVDNHTLTNNEEKMLRKYTDDIVMLDDNYGFAKANNKGIEYARSKYNSDYYIVINNDVFITQKDFLKVIDKDYEKYKFDVLGPKIESPTGESVNPFPVFKTFNEVKFQIEKSKKLIKVYSNPLLYYLLKIYLFIKNFMKKAKKPENGKQLMFDVPLHGCAIIFSKKYVKQYKYPFYNETFLFHEEEFLYHRVVEDKLISMYDPLLNVFHKEGSSVKKNRNERLSKLFREKEKIKSLKLLLEEMQV